MKFRKVKSFFQIIANQLGCQVRLTNAGAIFSYNGKEIYFSYFMNSKPNNTVKIVYNKDYKPGKAPKSVEVGNYTFDQLDLQNSRNEVKVKILEV